MPQALRRKHLQELDDIDQSHKRARLSAYLHDVHFHTSGDEADEVNSNTSDTSDTSVPSVSSPSNLSSGSDSDTSISLTSSEIMEDYLIAVEKEVHRLREEISTARVLRHKHKVPRIHLLTTWRDGINQFRRKVRVDPRTFDGILEKIRDDHIFHKKSNVPQSGPQIPVETQLAIFLYHAGHYGNVASPTAIGHWAGVSPDTVVDSINRVMIALLTFHDELIRLPTSEEKEDAKEWVAGKVCPEWRDGYLVVDGTKLALYQQPGLHGDPSIDKNYGYSIDCQLVVLPNSLLIADYAISCVYDSFRYTRIFRQHEHIFTPGEWVWADSAYPAESWCVPLFKKPVGGELTPDQRTYNYHVSKIRVCAEHAIGLLKGRFQALRELCIEISSKNDQTMALMFICCCLILHNLILHLEGGNFDANYREHLCEAGRRYVVSLHPDIIDELSDQADQELLRAQQCAETQGQQFRRQLVTRLFDSPSSGAVRRQ